MLSKEFGEQKRTGRILPTIDLYSTLVNYAEKNLQTSGTILIVMYFLMAL